MHSLFVSHQSSQQILSWSYFKIRPWNIKVRVIGEAKVQGHRVYPIRYIIFSSHVNTVFVPNIYVLAQIVLAWEANVLGDLIICNNWKGHDVTAVRFSWHIRYNHLT